MSSWLKIKGTQTGELQLGFDGPVLKKDNGNLILRDGANTANVNLVAANITASGVFTGDGGGLSNIAGANITGQVANALVAGTVTANAQPNITSVGILSSLSVSGNAAVGGILTNNYYYANGAPVDFQQAAGSNTQVQFNDNNDFGASPNFTFNTATDTLFATNVTGNGSGLSSITGANVTGQVGNALVAGTVYTNAQPNITSLGTLTSLAVSGNAVVNGDLVVNGNLTYVNVNELVVEDPMISLGGGPNGAPLTTNDGKDRGLQLNYYTTTPVDAFMGWDNSNAEFAFGSNVSITENQVVTFNQFGNVRAANFIGNLVGTASHATTANTVVDGAQANITSLGTLTGLSVNGTANLSAVSNVKISGGSAGFILSTDGAGNLSFVAPVSGASAWKAETTTVAFNSGATISAMTLPANAIVDKVSVIVDTPFNGTAPTLTVGLQGGTGLEYITAGDANLKVADRYDVFSQLAAVGTPGNIEILYNADGSSAGSSRVVITYSIPE